jgi:hypothetical protein
MEFLDLSKIPTPMLREIRKTLQHGAVAFSDTANDVVNPQILQQVVVPPEQPVQIVNELDVVKAELAAKIVELAAATIRIAELETKVSEKDVSLEDSLTKLKEIEQELITLRNFKTETEASAVKQKLLEDRKTFASTLGVSLDLDTDTEKWLSMEQGIFEFTVGVMKQAIASATVPKNMEIPPMTPQPELSAKEIVRQGLKERNRK